MNNRRSLFAFSVIAVAAAVISFWAGNGQAQPGGQAGSGFQPVMPLESLMEEQDRHFEGIVELLKKPDQKDWKAKIQHEALALGEMANINGYHKGAVEHADYKDWAAQLKDQCVKLAAAGRDSKVDDAKNLTKLINGTCQACHDKYKEK